jgi:putative transposase
LGQTFLENGFGCWIAGNIADKMVNEYLEHHRKSDNDTIDFILE